MIILTVAVIQQLQTYNNIIYMGANKGTGEGIHYGESTLWSPLKGIGRRKEPRRDVFL
jgi:hypothetical protein